MFICKVNWEILEILANVKMYFCSLYKRKLINHSLNVKLLYTARRFMVRSFQSNIFFSSGEKSVPMQTRGTTVKQPANYWSLLRSCCAKLSRHVEVKFSAIFKWLVHGPLPWSAGEGMKCFSLHATFTNCVGFPTLKRGQWPMPPFSHSKEHWKNSLHRLTSGFPGP